MEFSKVAEIVSAKIDTEVEVIIVFDDGSLLEFTAAPSDDDDNGLSIYRLQFMAYHSHLRISH